MPPWVKASEPTGLFSALNSMVMLEAEADDFRLADLEREEAEEAEAAAAKLAAKRERAKVALGMLQSLRLRRLRIHRNDKATSSWLICYDAWPILLPMGQCVLRM